MKTSKMDSKSKDYGRPLRAAILVPVAVVVAVASIC
jgi:hypothetical protein